MLTITAVGHLKINYYRQTYADAILQMHVEKKKIYNNLVP